MRILLIFLMTAAMKCFAIPLLLSNQEEPLASYQFVFDDLKALLKNESPYPNSPIDQEKAIQTMLHSAPGLQSDVIQKVGTSLKCIDAYYHYDYNPILSVIDYSLPSNAKRLWIFDLKAKKLLFYTYVSHGIKTGERASLFFSNKYNSKASSIGIYKTSEAYYGREGISLRLDGLERNFNDNANNRAIVMHGGWYVEEPFIKRYGRAGRSWGCPAVPKTQVAPIIQTIKNNSLLVAYYPNDHWLMQSKFLNCGKMTENLKPNQALALTKTLDKPPAEDRDPILYVDLNHNHAYTERKPVVVMPADTYEYYFAHAAPVGRMLRRQIEHKEYVVLSPNELSQIAAKQTESREGLENIYFVIPNIKMVRGYYETLMMIVPLGKIKSVQTNNSQINSAPGSKATFVVNLENNRTISLQATDQFIRWLGL